MPFRSGSVMAGLADLRFQTLVTPRLVGWLYAGVLAWLGGGLVFGLLVLWSLASWAGWAWWALVPVMAAGGLVTLLTARVALEAVLMWFTGGRGTTVRGGDDV